MIQYARSFKLHPYYHYRLRDSTCLAQWQTLHQFDILVAVASPVALPLLDSSQFQSNCAFTAKLLVFIPVETLAAIQLAATFARLQELRRPNSVSATGEKNLPSSGIKHYLREQSKQGAVHGMNSTTEGAKHHQQTFLSTTMFYDDYYNATTLNSIAADEDHALHFLDPVLDLFDPSNAVPEEDPFVGWTLNCESLLGFPINLSKHHSQDDPVTFDTPLTLAADASNRTSTTPAHKLLPAACMVITLDPSGADLCADDHIYAEKKRELFLEQQQSYATRPTPSPPLSEAVSSPSARDFDTPSPAADAASPTDNSPESLDHAVVEARVEIEVEFEDAQSDVDADGETDAGSELDEDADGEWDPDYEPAAPQTRPRLIIRLPVRSQSNAAPSIPSRLPLPPPTHDSESNSEAEQYSDAASEYSKSDDEDGDYSVRTRRPRSAPAAKRRRNNSGKAVAVQVAPRARGETASAGQIILPADTPRQFTQGADGRWPCPLAAKGCAHPSFKNRDGLWRHWADHLPAQPTMCPAGCGGKFKGARRDVIRKHLGGGCKAGKKMREKCLVALKGRKEKVGGLK
ncbi:hypothetical protein B0H16DRAFT_1474270 [Mycena metata]|uniref:Uncharacterized protein n=1 Tax=Mycena metata TaxID=1033252 RepID=A0AAD7HIC4_9AGAR|nr:hypothetical protein B0H16DRAFT_1474270 [Mycena metata]